MNWFTTLFSNLQQALYETLVQPAMFALGMANLLEDAYEGTAWLMVGVLQILILLAVIAPLQRWRPVDVVTDRATIRTDVFYTLLHRLGLFKLVLFFTLEPWFDEAFGAIRTAGYGTLHLDQLWPSVTDNAVVSLLLYLVVFDFVAYWVHRGQHQFEWWWRLHSLHHAQRQMTMWSDNRNHLLDSVLVDTIMVVVAQLIGVAPGQFIAIVALTQLSESLQHANLRLWFGHIGERLWVSPRFHRLHHSVGLGHETPIPSKNTNTLSAVRLGGFNFGVLLPWWDMLFKTVNFEQRYDPTGVRDQIEGQRDYGRGFWSQQWLGFKRLVGRA
ncbi:MAG: sterol desaturase family protein [Chitinophagaceae bacterium]|nr:sterol desaturase family protein [Polaromonas sp.]